MNISFMLRCVQDKRINELYLYAKLREFAGMKGGDFSEFKFTTNERYRLLPKIVRYGWVTEDMRLVNHRVVADVYNHTTHQITVPEYSLKSKNTFKGFIVDVAETFSLKTNYHKQKKFKVKNLREGKVEYKRLEYLEHHEILKGDKVKNFDCTFYGEISLGYLCKLLGLSKNTIVSWRKFSKNVRVIERKMTSFEDAHYINRLGVPIRNHQKIVTKYDICSPKALKKRYKKSLVYDKLLVSRNDIPNSVYYSSRR